MSLQERLVDRLTGAIVARPKAIVLVCLALTLLLLPGMALLETDAGTDQFVDDVPEYEALQTVNQEFEPPFADDEPSTQLIQRDENVLDRSALLAKLELKAELESRTELRVVEVSGPASVIAEELDPDAETAAQQHAAVERATQGEIDDAIDEVADDPTFETLVADDFNPEAGEASAALGVVTHSMPDDGDLQSLQLEAEAVAERTDGDVTVFGGGIVDAEFENVVVDSLLIVVPAALLLILALLLFAYRDPFDFALGTASLLITIVWTFGFTGYVGIPFSDMLIAVPVLLLAIGIDFGIHTINRYREERIAGAGIEPSMRTAIGQLIVAYAIIAGTTVIGFLANLTSDLGPIREFGIVAGIGIVFTLFIFGVFLPAAKVWLDQFRARRDLPSFGERPLGEEDSVLGRLLPYCSRISRPSPAIFLAVVLVLTAGLGFYGAGVDTTFDEEEFLPPEEVPAWIESLPGPFSPSEYTVTGTITYLEETFETGEDDTVTVYVEGRMTDDHALESLVRAEEDPPDSFVEREGRASTDTILDPIEGLAEEDPQFAALLDRNDLSGDGVPQRNLDLIYDQVFASPEAAAFAEEFMSDDYRSARVTYEVESGASQAEITDDAREQAENYRFDAVATGQIVVYQAVADVVFESAVVSLSTALVLSAVFLVIFYRILVGRGTLGAVNLVPVVVTICLLTASMRALDIPFNALTATILSITIGLGVDYTVHVSHRFHDEYEETDDVYGSIVTTLRGTGGALTGTMLTTALGIGVLVLAITDVLGQFGLLTAFSIVLAYGTALVILPPTLVCWVAITERRPDLLFGDWR